MRVTCDRCLRRYDVPDATVKGRKIRARCKCGARVIVQDEERAARSSASGSQTTGSIQRPVRWFVDITSWEPIAMDLRQLVRAFDGGRIDADTLVWRKGMPDWRRLRDVPELAERLMGAEAAAKASAAEAPLEAASAAPEHPLQQNRAERSRTPPANYSVDERAPAADTLLSGVARSASAQKEASPSSEAAATMPGASAAPHTPPGGYGSPEPPRVKPSDRRSAMADGAGFGAVHAAQRLTPGAPVISAKSGSTQMGLSAAGLTPAPAEQRSVTQTGLAPAPEPGRAAHAESADARASEVDVDVARVSMAPSPRNARSASPAPGARRRASSDETPAQKPASISVSSSALAQASAVPRGKQLVALGVLLLGAGVVMVRGTSTDVPVSVPAASPERRASVASDLPRIEKSAPLPLEPVPEPKPAAPQDGVALGDVAQGGVVQGGLAHGGAGHGGAAQGGAGHATGPSSAAAAPAKAVPVDPVAQNSPRGARLPAAPAPVAALVPSKPAPAAPPAASAPRLEIHPSSPEAPATSSGEPPVTGRAEIAAPAVPAPAPAPPAAPMPPPSAVPPSAVPPSAPTPAVFDEKRAREQMGLAAFKASTCNQLGDTRGSGQVSVVIQTWGRVVRVTHQNQAFVGTPVGVCIMEAFQQVQVPPFEGGPRTLVGSFLVQ
ncbi:MAG TPA: GYF domain-containing protein [Polyangiaceae bacterium]|nr:GYF domain-containing protein [Polyangiaceae bacterium]